MKDLKKAFFIVILLVCNVINAQINEVNLWKGEIPNAIKNSEFKEVKEFKDSVLNRTSKVSVPTITFKWNFCCYFSWWRLQTFGNE